MAVATLEEVGDVTAPEPVDEFLDVLLIPAPVPMAQIR
jgi:hypothetical protein